MIPSTVQPVLVVTGTCADCGAVGHIDIIAASPAAGAARRMAHRTLADCDACYSGNVTVTETTGFVPVEL